ncbi:MAG: hypothetical protein LBD06_09460 [Candidatus Accumulibacter sp.]|nr:hypothetical protein [Accumulibacter sp.]
MAGYNRRQRLEKTEDRETNLPVFRPHSGAKRRSLLCHLSSVICPLSSVL